MKTVVTYCGVVFEIDHRWYTTTRDTECVLHVDTEFSTRGGGYLNIRVGVYADNTLILSAQREDTDAAWAFNCLYSAIKTAIKTFRTTQTPLYRNRAFELVVRAFNLPEPSIEVMYRELLEAAAIADGFASGGNTQAVRDSNGKA